nr:MAG TPA: hypothetical protein [Caudoviricetes sp.]
MALTRRDALAVARGLRLDQSGVPSAIYRSRAQPETASKALWSAMIFSLFSSVILAIFHPFS